MNDYDVTLKDYGVWRMPALSEEDALKSIYVAFKYATGEGLSYKEFKELIEDINKIWFLD